MIFSMRYKRKQKNMRKKELSIWNDLAVWKDFILVYMSKAVWKEYIQHMMSRCFKRCSQSDVENWNQHVHDFITTHTSSYIPFISHAKQMIKFIVFELTNI